MSAFKFLTFLFPFIREMILGDKTIKDALKTNKTRVLLIFLILFSFFLNFSLVPKIIRISAYAVSLEKELKVAKGEGPAEDKGKTQVASASKEHKPEKPSDKLPDKTADPPTTSLIDLKTPEESDTQDAVNDAASGVQHDGSAKIPESPLKTPRLPRARLTDRPHRDDRYDDWKKSFDTIKSQETPDDSSHGGPVKAGPPSLDTSLYHHH